MQLSAYAWLNCLSTHAKPSVECNGSTSGWLDLNRTLLVLVLACEEDKTDRGQIRDWLTTTVPCPAQTDSKQMTDSPKRSRHLLFRFAPNK